jgi:hypothetical protein
LHLPNFTAFGAARIGALGNEIGAALAATPTLSHKMLKG